MSNHHDNVIEALRRDTPDLVRWSGAVAKKLRTFNIAIDGKSSGSVFTDALTLADLTVQELIIAGLRDRSPILRECRIEAEEANGDFTVFADEAELTISLDPIDGTRQFRDHTGDGYSIMIHLRSRDDVTYSLVFAPEEGPTGTWTQAYKNAEQNIVKTGPDDTSVSAFDCLEQMPAVDMATRPNADKIYIIGFQDDDPAVANQVTEAGLTGVAPDDMPACIYSLIARGDFGGSLIHTPNIYDYPVAMQLVRAMGGNSVWVHNQQPVHFDETWMDERADMLRLPGIVATADNDAKLKILCELAKDWSGVRYKDAPK